MSKATLRTRATFWMSARTVRLFPRLLASRTAVFGTWFNFAAAGNMTANAIAVIYRHVSFSIFKASRGFPSFVPAVLTCPVPPVLQPKPA
jgi:hypothetical protein